MAQSKAAVKRQPAPLVKVDYRFDMTKGTVAGFVVAGLAVGFLLFVSGVVLGVQLNLSVDDAAESSAVTEPAVVEPAVEEAVSLLRHPGPLSRHPGESRDPVAVGSSLGPGSFRRDDGGADGRFILQAGAFRSPENAENMRMTLSSGGLEPRVVETPASGGGPLFRVVMGRYRSETEARRAAESFSRRTGRAVYVMAARELGS